jgi:hypothetical protein
MKPLNTTLDQPLPQRYPGVGRADSSGPAAVIANGTTMVVVFVGWLTALISCQSVLFTCDQTFNKVDYEFLSQYSTKLIKISITHIIK